MAGIVRWFKSGGAVLTKFTPLKSRDEGEDNREMTTQPRSPEGNLDGKDGIQNSVPFVVTNLDSCTLFLLKNECDN